MNGVASFSPISCPFQHMWQWKPDELAFSLRSQDLLIHSACRPRNEDGNGGNDPVFAVVITKENLLYLLTRIINTSLLDILILLTREAETTT